MNFTKTTICIFIASFIAGVSGLIITSKGMLFENIYIVPPYVGLMVLFIYLNNRWTKKQLNEINVPEIPACVVLPYDEVKNFLYKVEVEFNVSTNDKEAIKNELSFEIANHLINNDLISYSIQNKNNSVLSDDFNMKRVHCNFIILTKKNTQSYENTQNN